MTTPRNFVRGTLNYFTPPKDGSAPWSNIHANAETGLKERNYEEKAYEVDIENVRGNEDQYTLDATGFEFHRVPTKLTADDFSNDEKVKQEYYEEQSEIIRKITGASKVVLFDHTIRRTQPGVKLETASNRHPVTFVHVDQNPLLRNRPSPSSHLPTVSRIPARHHPLPTHKPLAPDPLRSLRPSPRPLRSSLHKSR